MLTTVKIGKRVQKLLIYQPFQHHLPITIMKTCMVLHKLLHNCPDLTKISGIQPQEITTPWSNLKWEKFKRSGLFMCPIGLIAVTIDFKMLKPELVLHWYSHVWDHVEDSLIKDKKFSSNNLFIQSIWLILTTYCLFSDLFVQGVPKESM